MDALWVVVNIAVLVALIGLLAFMQVKHLSFSKRVFAGLGLGILLGGALQLIYGPSSNVIKNTADWYNIVGNGYVKLLQMIVIPLVLVSIISAIVNLRDTRQVGKISGLTIGTLMSTAAIAAAIGIAVALLFDLNAGQIVAGQAELKSGTGLTDKLGTFNQESIPQRVLDLLPANPFQDMTGARSSSTIAVVIFAAFVGIAALTSRKKYPEQIETFEKIVAAFYTVVIRIVQLVLKLTPFGVLAIMSRTVAQTSFDAILKLIKFVGASYVALLIVLLVHLTILALFRLNPAMYLKKVWQVLSFAFTSRSSMSTVPLTIDVQTRRFGVEKGIANFAATFGTSIGQNGCAGIYPAMLAVMIAPTVGINPADPGFIITLIVVVALSSFGIAGVGGGATYAALLVLSSMGLPVALAGLLVSVEPLIDMGRTAINVSDSVVAGLVTGRILKKIDTNVYNSNDNDISSDSEVQEEQLDKKPLVFA